MVKWLDKLKALFNIELNAPIVNIIINSKSNNPNYLNKESHYDKEKQTLEVFNDNLSKDKVKALKPILKEYIESDNKLLEADTSDLLTKLYNYDRENKNSQVLAFFKPIIPIYDFEALEAALYLRDVFERKEDIRKLKEDIKKRFGDRGNNISNLCTAGYFEEFLMQLYNFEKERFDELYELIIQKAVVAVFVYKTMAQEDITAQVNNKLNISKKYGINFIHIHGIGNSNISKVRKCIDDNRKFFEFFEKRIYKKDNIMIVELLLK